MGLKLGLDPPLPTKPKWQNDNFESLRAKTVQKTLIQKPNLGERSKNGREVPP
ncbi:hypothetical protein TorRG33x02_025130 [Trema orientale]|uniref:Uncharacterized protein n=1 Tax=Trema orientale TaxID=63057 RepID=A0A2P5FVB7_TREOI|nr:hypothetical protein TorRG33x02_025130 [Trema orientale]